MKVLLANPPWKEGYVRAGSRWAHTKNTVTDTFLDRLITRLEMRKSAGCQSKEYRTFPFFIGYAAAMLENAGFEVKVIDSLAQDQDEDGFMGEVASFRPDVCVFETSTPSLKNDMRIMGEVKKRAGCITVACGPHVSAVPRDVLSLPFMDFACIGEYELSLLGLVQAIAQKRDCRGVKGIAYMENGKLRTNERMELIKDLDEMPLPAWHLMPMEKYYTPYSRTETSMEVLSTRGCPFQCTYCVFPQLIYNGHSVRFRSPEKVVDEIEILMEKYGKKGIYFNDDTFTVRKSHVMGICKEIDRRKLRLKWGCFGRVDTVDMEMLSAMKKSGCALIKYGVESGSQKILDNVRKGYKLEDVVRAFRMTKEVGIGTHGTFMIGLPGETRETVKESLEFAKKIDPDSVIWALTTPFPGTELHRQATEKGHLMADDYCMYDGNRYVIMRTDEMTIDEIKNAWLYVNSEWEMRKKSDAGMVKQYLSSNYREVGAAGLVSRGVASSLKMSRKFIERRKRRVRANISR